MNNHSIRLGTMLVGGALLAGATGCAKDAYLEPFADCDELESYIHDVAIKEYNWQGSNGGGGWGGFAPPVMGGAEDMAVADGGVDQGGSTNSHSTTNTQEVDVDEADFVKNDGEFIYVINGGDLAIIDAWPAEELAEVSRLAIEGTPQSMYLDGDVLAVLSTLDDDTAPAGGGVATMTKAVTKITLFDIADRAAPVVAREVYVEGNLYDSRRVEQRLYLITSRDLADTDLRAESDSMTTKEVKDAVRGRDLDQWMPRRAVNTMRSGSWSMDEQRVCDCSDVYRPNREAGLVMMSVLALDIADLESDVSGTSILAGTGEIYASPESLYLAVYEPDDGPFRVTSGGIGTRVHKFDLEGGPEHPAYVASGRVEGWVHDSWAMDEADGTFRIATTAVGGNGGGQATGVYMMEQDGSELTQIGAVDDIAPGEDVYAVRFTDDAAYVVTFMQIDPLFTIDLRDPTAPAVLGELEVTGYSTYLHPMAQDGYLLAIGDEIGSDGWQFLGVQLSIFDVTDMANPKLHDREVVEASWGSSEAAYDHHAFNYYEPLDLLAVPMTVEVNWGEVTYSGLEVYDVTVADGIVPIGAIDASLLIDVEASEYYATYCSQIRRSIVIEDVLYGVASGGIVAAQAYQPDELLAVLAFPTTGNCDSYDESWEQGW